MSDKKNMLNGSQAVKMEINSKPATNSCDFSQCSSSGTTVAQQTGNLKLRSAIGTLRLRLRQILFPLCASFASLVRMLILNCEFSFDSLLWCFRILVVLKFRASAVETGSGTQDQTERATSSQCTHWIACFLPQGRKFLCLL